MKKFRFYVFPYRDRYFLDQFGPIVRDLMIIDELSKSYRTDKVIIYNRPVTLHELILGKKKFSGLRSFISNDEKRVFESSLSLEVFGPLKRRLWLDNCYAKNYNEEPEFSGDYINVVLDFLPIGRLPKWATKADIYWYDLIDNFTKHNRYSAKEKCAVERKYLEVKSRADLVTGVSSKCFDLFGGRGRVVSNAILKKIEVFHSVADFDFGFVGFVTNKFDVDLIRAISKLGHSVAIFGSIYDKSVEDALKQINNVFLFGAFGSKDVSSIFGRFKVGLVPYHLNMLHDESPLKIYQYLATAKPVLSSSSFGLDHPRLFVYGHQSNDKLKIEESLASSKDFYKISENELESFLWKGRIKEIFDELLDVF